MAKTRTRPIVVLAPAARNDIREALKWSEERFGKRAALRYQALLKQALRDIGADPERPGSRERPELAEGVRSYHLLYSRNRAQTASGIVRNPRRLLIYSRRERTIDVVRILYDARELRRHLPDALD